MIHSTNDEQNSLFSEHSLSGTLSNLREKARQTINALQVGDVAPEYEEQLLARLHDEFIVASLHLRRDAMSREGPNDCEIELSGESAFAYGEDHVFVRGETITIVVPFDGDKSLWTMRPSQWNLSSPRASVVDGEIRFTYRGPNLDAEELKRDVGRRLNDIDSYIRRQATDIHDFNEGLVQSFKPAIEARRKELATRKADFADALGIPERKKTASPVSQLIATKRPRRTKRKRVFLCYVKRDLHRVRELYQALSDAGVEVWMDKEDLVLGDVWETEIEAAVNQSDAFVACLRPEFDEIGYRQKEVRLAIEAWKLRPPGRSFIIPFIVEPCELPDWCKPLHAGPDLTKPSVVDDLLRAIEKHCK